MLFNTFAGIYIICWICNFWAMLISVILSWVALALNAPGALFSLEQIKRLCNRNLVSVVIPTIGGLDLRLFLSFLRFLFEASIGPYVFNTGKLVRVRREKKYAPLSVN